MQKTTKKPKNKTAHEIDQDSETPECYYSGCESDCPQIIAWKKRGD